MTKTKKEIVKEISEATGLTQVKTKEIVQMVLDAIVDSVVQHGRIELRNFGVFEVKRRAARKARNPRTGEQVDVGEKYVVTFKPGKRMEKLVWEYGKRAEAAMIGGVKEVSSPAPVSVNHSEPAVSPSVPDADADRIAGIPVAATNDPPFTSSGPSQR